MPPETLGHSFPSSTGFGEHHGVMEELMPHSEVLFLLDRNLPFGLPVGTAEVKEKTATNSA